MFFKNFFFKKYFLKLFYKKVKVIENHVRRLLIQGTQVILSKDSCLTTTGGAASFGSIQHYIYMQQGLILFESIMG